MDVKKLQYIVCQMETQEMHSITQQLSCNLGDFDILKYRINSLVNK